MKQGLTLLFVLASIAAAAAPSTQVAVSHPVTAGTVEMPRTHAAVTKPTTFVSVQHPTTFATKNPPITQVSVTKPTTHVAVTHPTTFSSVTHPVTTGNVFHPTTAVTVTHPTTLPIAELEKVSKPGRGGLDGKMGSSSASGSYEASYKNVKAFSAADVPAADIPKAVKLSGGQGGLGVQDDKAAEKEALAAQEKAKAESAEASIDDVLKKTKLPSGLDSMLKQRNFEAGGLDKHSKKK